MTETTTTQTTAEIITAALEANGWTAIDRIQIPVALGSAETTGLWVYGWERAGQRIVPTFSRSGSLIGARDVTGYYLEGHRVLGGVQIKGKRALLKVITAQV